MFNKSKISYDEFFIIESLLYTKQEGYHYLPPHLERMHKSANYFGFVFDINAAQKTLEEYAASLTEHLRYKVRLSLHENGKYDIESEPIFEDTKPKKIRLSEHKTSANNIFYYHKTTKRGVYNAEFQKFCKNGEYFDVLFMNKENEITEGTRTNIFIQKNGILYTPPLHCGLLNGIMRQVIIDSRRVKEKVLTLEHLVTADKIFLTNSVRGMLEVIPG